MAGGPSHLETLDFKPKLKEMHGKPMPESYTKGQQIAQLQGRELTCFGPQHEFQRYGQSGQEISAVLPNIGKIADDICIIRSMQTEQINHDPAHTFMNTGSGIPGRPSMGSWILYGLGSDSQDLPGYVVLTSVGGGQSQPIAARQWHSGFLPSRFQGVQFQSAGDPVLYVGNPPGVSESSQRGFVKAVNKLNRIGNRRLNDPELETRISQYEMAFRMQSSVPDLTDTTDEPKQILESYGPDVQKPGTYAANCLLARRLAERDVRCIQLFHMGWDHHGGLPKAIRGQCKDVDQPTAALIADLRQRGLLEDTLIVWGGEFGGTIYSQGKLSETSYGRDHHPRCFTIFIAGAGVQKYGTELEEHQQLLLAVADILIEIYMVESALLRTEKNVDRNGEESQKLQIAMTQLYLFQAVEKINTKGKEAIVSAARGDEAKMLPMGLKRFTKYVNPPNVIALRNQVAERITAENQYCF